MNSKNEEYYELRKLAQKIGVKADTLRVRVKRGYYDFKRIPIDHGKDPIKIINGRTYYSKGLAQAILLYKPFKKMEENGQSIEIDEYGYLNADDFKINFELLKKKLVNDLKQDDRYTSKTKKIINNIDSLFNKLIRAYKNFEPHDDLDKGTVVGVFDNIRLVAKKNQKNQNK